MCISARGYEKVIEYLAKEGNVSAARGLLENLRPRLGDASYNAMKSVVAYCERKDKPIRIWRSRVQGGLPGLGKKK